jgi:protein-disulfide isomerase
MNIKRILSWGAFIAFIGLIVWGMIAASNKAERESLGIMPVDKVSETDWVKGATTTGVTIVEYSDFQCPACAAYFPLVEEVYSKESNNFQFVYRHFPLSQHKNAIPAAQAAEAAGKQGKFWDMSEKIFSLQDNWATSTDPKTVFVGYAKDLSLDITKFEADYSSDEIKAKIDADLKSGLKAGVNSTPTFYLNGKKINAQTYEQFKKLINEAATSTTNS